MTRRRQGWPVWAIAVLAVVLIGVALTQTGGPMQGRAERRDEVRIADLNALMAQAGCRAAAAGTVTADLTATPACPDAPRATDPFTDRPYRIEVVDAENLRLCAAFETQAWTGPHLRRRDVRADGDCLIHRIVAGQGGEEQHGEFD